MKKNQLPSAKGQGLVEFALILLFLLLLAFGVMDFARVFHGTVAITGAAREAARYVTRNPNDIVGGQNAAAAEAQNAGISITGTDVVITCTDLNANTFCDPGLPVIATVSFQFNTMLGNLFTASTLTVQRSAEMIVP